MASQGFSDPRISIFFWDPRISFCFSAYHISWWAVLNNLPPLPSGSVLTSCSISNLRLGRGKSEVEYEVSTLRRSLASISKYSECVMRNAGTNRTDDQFFLLLYSSQRDSKGLHQWQV